MEAAHNTRLTNCSSFTTAEKEVAKLICDAVDMVYYKDLEHPTTFHNSVTAATLLSHLHTSCKGRTPEDLISLQTVMTHFYTKCDGILEYISKLKEARKTLTRGGLPMPDN